MYLHRVPAPPLDAFIESIWYHQSDPRPHALERVLPTGAAQLIVNLKDDQTRVYGPNGDCQKIFSGAVLCGVQSQYCLIDTAEQEWAAGVVFRPGGTVPFFQVPANELCDAHIPLEALCGRLVADLREQLLEATSPQAKLDTMERALLNIRKPCYLHPAVAFALETFGHLPSQASIAAVSGMVGLSPKRFIERFKTAVGVTPKRYCRILRFQRALTRAVEGHRVDWTRIAADCWYFDQAHFIHDFRSFAGITPTEYQAGRTNFQNHVKFLQSDIPLS